MSDRDTHFAGFAKLLWREMLDLKGGYIDESDGYYRGSEEHPEYEAVIARRAYDLVPHALMHTTPAAGSSIRKFQGLSIEEIAKALPDMSQAEWPVGWGESGGSNPA